MTYKLSRYEQETIINFNCEEDKAILYTADPARMKKMDKLVEDNPKEFEMFEAITSFGKVIAKRYKFPKEYISIRSKRRTVQWSEEQRKAAAERMKEIHSKR